MSSIDNDLDEDEVLEESHVNWSNLIFLPFHPISQLIVMCSVVTKTILGPIQSVYPVVYCWEVMDYDPFLSVLKLFYWYCADFIYGIDMLLHIIHRQVTDEAMKREHLPKSGLCIILDLAAIIPFFRLLVTNDCPSVQFWPNILSFSESLVMYRIFQYYKLVTTHSTISMLFGFFLLMFCVVNVITCFWLLLTYHGLCNACRNSIYDWRRTVEYKLNETGTAYSTYVYGMVYVLSFVTNSHIDDIRPFTIREYIIVNMFVLFGYLSTTCFIVPKMFAETILRHRRIATAYPHVQRLVEETKRRNISSNAYKTVEKIYDIIWNKRSGVTRMPEHMLDIPRYLRLDVKQDLSWALFHHSPTLRNTSIPFKRYIVELITPDFKLPGEKFFAGPQSYTNICYIKSGVVQFFSEDEGMTPILSVTSGTIFGDISFLIPPWRRKVIIKCLTYCQVISLTRHDYIQALHKFPEDKNEILRLAQERITHAKNLYACKRRIRGLDRAEDEGIFWIKRRWWELSDFITNWKKKDRKERQCDLPPEETEYHCAKYIGQLVLCTEAQLLTKSLFVNATFPWLFVPQSSFILGWRKIVLVTVVLVLFLYPPFIIGKVIPIWFKLFQILVDLVYVFDIIITLLTSTVRQDSLATSFAAVMFAHCRTLYFNLDVFATIWIEYVVAVVWKADFFYIAQANRLIKIYILFTGEFTQSDVKKNPLYGVYIRIILCQFCALYISGYLVYSLAYFFTKDLTLKYLFGENYCEFTQPGICDPGARGPMGIAISWFIETIMYSGNTPRSLIDIYLAISYAIMSYLLCVYCKTSFISAIYLKYREVSNFRFFVSNLKKYYKYYKIHQDLLKRLDGYLMCHWKYFHGADIMHPNILKDEPIDIYWKVQGEVAEKIIGQSEAFVGADPGLVKDLACSAKFQVLPKASTLFLFGVQCKMVVWVAQGYVSCEYYDEEGELLTVYIPPGCMLSVSSVFLGNASLRTYSTCTDCEILYIKIQDFYKIIKNYPNEWTHLNRCITEFAPIFDDMFRAYAKKYKSYQKNLKRNTLRSKKATGIFKALKDLSKTKIKNRRILPIDYDFWTEPESDFMQYWMLFRAIIVVVSILIASVQADSCPLLGIGLSNNFQDDKFCASLVQRFPVNFTRLVHRVRPLLCLILDTLCGSGAVYRRYLNMIAAFCDCIAWIDIVLKLFMAYYTEKGILVFDKQQCMLHYLSRGFMLDIIGCAPWYQVLNGMMSGNLDTDICLLLNTVCKFAHLYIFIGYMDYISDRPTMNMVYMKILKWQVVLILSMMGCSHFLMTYCVDFKFNDRSELTGYVFLNTCWLPTSFGFQSRYMDVQYVHLTRTFSALTSFVRQNISSEMEHFQPLLYAESIYFAQCGLVAMNTGGFVVNRSNLGVGIPLVFLLLLFWYVMAYSMTLLVLNSRSNTLFQHGVNQLRKFLAAERVEPKLIDNATAHFSYWWHRTKGINMQHLTNERIGVVFRQDLSYYFFKKTFIALNKILQSSENLCRQLASYSTQMFLLPGEEIVREMDLACCVYIVHRGRVIISKDGEVVTTLSKGSIFGQLEGTISRPVKISAKSEYHADLLIISIKNFQEIITDDVRKIIAGNPTSKDDYLVNMTQVVEDPYDSIMYILRGRKTIFLPWMEAPHEAHHGSWYYQWLYIAWLLEPFTTAFVVMTSQTLTIERFYKIYFVLIILDILFFINFLSEFYAIELEVLGQHCFRRRVGYRMFKKLTFYLDVITLLGPLLTFFTRDVTYQLIKILRLRFWYHFKEQFCKTFKSDTAPILLKLAIVILLLHSFTCGWIVVACRGPFPIPTPSDMSESFNNTVNTDEWVFPEHRPGGNSGCARLLSKVHPVTGKPIFVVPAYWYNDYVLAVTYILMIFTHTDSHSFVPVTISQIIYQVFVTFVMFVIEVWLMSVALSYVYMVYRELYQYDYNIHTLITYLRHSGLSPLLVDSIKEYTSLLWMRQRGNWLPELAQQAPMCLREDLLLNLYGHHLEGPPLFRDLPFYFKRQLAARLKRIVIFPGKIIVTEGDIFPCMYFIHEGEVEKWYRDKDGESRIMSLLSTNGYFGQVSVLLPNYAFKFSYYSRTVVDVVFLHQRYWKDLLEGYPDIKRTLHRTLQELTKIKN